MSSFTPEQIVAKNMPSNKCFAILKLAFDRSILGDNIVSLYKYHIDQHNLKMVSDHFPNSGFDLLVANDVDFQIHFKTVFVDHGVKSEMLYYDRITKDFEPSAFTMEPRSSISKTPLMMANHIGIIDSGYRGNLLAAVRYLPGHDHLTYTLESKTRLFQVCHPSLCPIYVMIVNEEELSNTLRGTGGFGSTGL
jgi:dUTP pyrophosphatase